MTLYTTVVGEGEGGAGGSVGGREILLATVNIDLLASHWT